MSASSGSGVSGIVQNSALAFVASAQGISTDVPTNSATLQGTTSEVNQTDHLMPPGLNVLYETCTKVYPDQPNPLQVTTRLKYWLGGHDPLDYISMYWNPGRAEENITPHWHYVRFTKTHIIEFEARENRSLELRPVIHVKLRQSCSPEALHDFGLSDLHGDGRVHPEPYPGGCSGYGLELTFRLESEEREPPLWPAALLQALARYIFTTGNKFMPGDHVTWHAPLDGANSRLRHLLVTEDPQLGKVDTPHGGVSFVQMVGCTSRELRAAQRGSGLEVIEAISKNPRCGGPWLVSRVSRGSARLPQGSRAAHLAGVSARVRWLRNPPVECNMSVEQTEPLSPSVEQQIKETLQRGLCSMTDRGTEGHNMSTDSFEMSSIERALPQLPETMEGSWSGSDEIEYLDSVHIIFNAEGASLLPLAIDGRVLHSRHFTWRQGPRAVTILPPTVAGAFVTPEKPYAVRGGWLQVLIPLSLARAMAPQVSALSRFADSDSESDADAPPPCLPLALSWPTYKLSVSVERDDVL